MLSYQDEWAKWLNEDESTKDGAIIIPQVFKRSGKDHDWENANLSQGERSDINHLHSTHFQSAYQRRKRRNS